MGSINQDLVVRVPAHPRPGETVLGFDHFTGAGGKGANQAVAAARLGADVGMTGKVGDDLAGVELRVGLVEAGIDISGVTIHPDAATGLAVITLDDAGENAIVVSPGANARLSTSDVLDRSAWLAGAAIVLLQLEVPLDAVGAAAAAAAGKVVLNPAPAVPLQSSILELVDVLVPNRSELAVLAGSSEIPEVLADVEEMAGRMSRSLKPSSVMVVTLGPDGALVVDRGECLLVPAPDIDPVDTTAAGDAFCGAMAEALARGESLEVAVAWAVAAGAITATRLGAQASLPTAAEVAALQHR